MNEHVNGRALRIISVNGTELTAGSLPSSKTVRWVARRKADVVAAVRGGLLSVDQACARYGLSEEELTSWQDLVDAYGLQGLRTTKANHYRAKTKFTAD